MSNEQKYIITVRYPEWEQAPIADLDQTEPTKYSAYGVRYLFVTDIIPYPEWPEDDERWFSYTETDEIATRFKKWYKDTIKGEFDGEILFIESSDLVIANAREQL